MSGLKMNWFCVFCLSLLAGNLVASEECLKRPKIICYYSSWAYYRPDIGFFDTNNINTSLCTHVIYTFAGININQGLDYIDQNVDVARGGMRNFTDLKVTNPCLKTILAIGGWNEEPRKYSVMVSTEEARNAFVESALRFVVAYNFDGLDVDWEYPGQRGGIAEDKENFALLLEALHNRFSKWDLQISIAAPIITSYITEGYDVEAIGKYVEFVSLMAYDYTATTSPTTGLMAPLSEIKKSVDFWIENRFPREKLVLGLPSYARSYTLLDAKDNGIGAATKGTGRAGAYTNEKGFLSYFELQKLLKTDLFTIKKEDGNCYAYYKNDWFSFDDTETYNDKIAYVIDKGLGGVMLWTLDTDDFSGIYGKKYALLSAIKDKLTEVEERKHV